MEGLAGSNLLFGKDRQFSWSCNKCIVQDLNKWSYRVEFINVETDYKSNLYVYEVKWSVPMAGFFEPLVTASVFFCIEVIPVKPFTIDVSIEYISVTNNCDDL